MHLKLPFRIRNAIHLSDGNLELPKLSDEDRDSLEGQLTYDECKKVLETLQNDKPQGKTVLQSNFINTSLN